MNSNRHTVGASATPSGSRRSDQAATRLAPSGFDPSRDDDFEDCDHCGGEGWVHSCIDDMCANAEDGCEYCQFRCEFCNPTLAVPTFLRPRDAIATEARRATTTEIGSVHEGAGPQDIAHD